MPRDATNCTEDRKLKSFMDEDCFHNCIGMIDINGMKGPHKAIDCADGKSRQHLWDTEDGVLTHCDVKAGDKADNIPICFL